MPPRDACSGIPVSRLRCGRGLAFGKIPYSPNGGGEPSSPTTTLDFTTDRAGFTSDPNFLSDRDSRQPCVGQRAGGLNRTSTSVHREPTIIDCSKLRNRYLVLRHGQSQANELGLIASSPETAVAGFGLTEVGRQQVAAEIERNIRTLASIAAVFSSDFLRARQTAEMVARRLQVRLECSLHLRERGFGDWEGEADEHYRRVWDEDALNAGHTRWGVEAVAAVASRMCQFLAKLDQADKNQTFLIVSHGDPLQILITSALGRDLREHRQIDSLGTGELRPLC